MGARQLRAQVLLRCAPRSGCDECWLEAGGVQGAGLEAGGVQGHASQTAAVYNASWYQPKRRHGVAADGMVLHRHL
eukprot:CAMPEP_0173127364 /NCGR_PEP_ID=MMETSP1102-20130122/57742_1 /TAXON_ID=49646 /ORGANISM="Geminigera sp., Strain Caron Lab Isolate" /LENGTH=75 /DNA_ID=CAMNT_0014036957 /DNA_START=192 /DNA_END=419 /DNA_ORIENTATION=+